MSGSELQYDMFREIDPEQQLHAARNDCERAFYNQNDRMVHKWHHYLEIYARHFETFRRRPIRLLEIGIQNGGSLQMWRRYFGPEAILHGLDIDGRCRQIDDMDLHVHIGNQIDPGFLDAVVAEMDGLDIVIDDGSHVCSHQIAAFEHLWPKLSDGGIYLCEDVHTSYWSEYGGGLRRPGSFIEYAKCRADDLHANYLRDAPALTGFAASFAQTAWSVQFYDGIVVLEKRERKQPFATVMGTRCIIPELLGEMAKRKRG